MRTDELLTNPQCCSHTGTSAYDRVKTAAPPAHLIVWFSGHDPISDKAVQTLLGGLGNGFNLRPHTGRLHGLAACGSLGACLRWLDTRRRRS